MDYDGRLVALAREGKGWNQAALARASGMSQAYISKIENGNAELSDDRANVLASFLECPVTLFTSQYAQASLSVTCVHNRRRASQMSATTRKRLEAVARLTALSVNALLALPPNLKELLALREGVDRHDPKEAARAIRAHLRNEDLPIASVVRLVESLGVAIVRRPFPTGSQDAMSIWVHGSRPVIILATGCPADRERFSLAHELGHLLLHALPSETQEDEANEFAAELLAPEVAIQSDLEGLVFSDLNRLTRLKGKWGVSIAALARRARDLGILTEEQYRSFNVLIARLGWRKDEPGSVVLEPVAGVNSFCASSVADAGTAATISAKARMTPEAFSRYYVHDWSAH